MPNVLINFIKLSYILFVCGDVKVSLVLNPFYTNATKKCDLYAFVVVIMCFLFWSVKLIFNKQPKINPDL